MYELMLRRDDDEVKLEVTLRSEHLDCLKSAYWWDWRENGWKFHWLRKKKDAYSWESKYEWLSEEDLA